MKKRRGLLRLTRLILLVTIPLVFSLASAGDVQVITGQSTPVDSIDDALIKNIFLGKKRTLPNGEHVEFVILKSGDAHVNFLNHFIKKSPSQFKTYWKKQLFTGKGKIPKTFATEGELVKYVSRKPGILGYVSSGADIDGAKVVNEK